MRAALRIPGSLTGQTLVFGLGAVAGKVVGLLLLPILTRALTRAEYGQMDVLLAVGNETTFILLLGLDVAALRLWFDQPDDAARRRLVATWYAIAIGLALVVASVTALAAGQVSEALFGRGDLRPAVLAVAVIVVAQTVQVVVTTVLRARGRAAWFALISGGVLVLYGAFAVGLVAAGWTDANAVVLAFAAALVVSALVGTWLVRRDVLARPSAAMARSLLRLGLPLAPAVVATLAADLLVRVTLLGAVGPEQVAYFTVGNRFASVPGIAVAAVQLAWLPRVYALGSGSDALARIAAEAGRIVTVVSVLVIGVAVVAPEAVGVVAGSGYAEALPALGFALVGVLGAALYLVASTASSIARRTSDLALASGAAAGVSVVLNVILAPIWQSAGTAAAVAAGQIVAAAIVGTLGARRMTIGIRWSSVGGVAMTATGVVLALVLTGAGPLPRLAVGLAVLAAGAWRWTVRGRPGARRPVPLAHPD